MFYYYKKVGVKSVGQFSKENLLRKREMNAFKRSMKAIISNSEREEKNKNIGKIENCTLLALLHMFAVSQFLFRSFDFGISHC